jgi:hypothetical protein
LFTEIVKMLECCSESFHGRVALQGKSIEELENGKQIIMFVQCDTGGISLLLGG